MNKKIIIIITGVVVLLLLVTFLFLDNSTEDKIIPNEIGTFPEPTEPIDREVGLPLRMTVLAQNDLSFEVSDFIRNGETIEDPSNDNHYILAGDLGYCLPNGECPAAYGTDSFSVSYSSNDNYFTLVILSEPIAESRKNAESFLMSRLGIGEQEMCQLHYSFSAPYWVNEFYAGRELGFSFCPGSVSLE